MTTSQSQVFIVDDDSGIRTALRRLTTIAGFNAHFYASAEEFLDVATPMEHACLVLDVRLPGLDGLELAGAIREQSRFATLPCIGLSAKAGDDDRERWLALGVGDYLVKPVDVHELHSVLSKVLNEEAVKP